LTHFPFATLPGRKPGSYLIEDVAIGYLGSGREAAKMMKAHEGPATCGLLAIGGIDYEANPGEAVPAVSATAPSVLPADSQRAGFKSLAGTGPEAQHIGELFGSAFPGQQAEVLTSSEPTESKVKQLLGGHLRYVHLATHGFFESPARIAAIRAGLNTDRLDAELAGADIVQDSAALALAPLLHSGLAFAGAARTPEEIVSAKVGGPIDREDCILTAEEVQSLDLRGAELVVLSACDTGLGKGCYGQGVLGLQSAFLSAGARAVVASLWKVDDAATSVLMEHFYTNLWSR
jgi:CHAT domain-containing protein